VTESFEAPVKSRKIKRVFDRFFATRTPLRPQFQTTECGVSVLRIMLAYFGADVPAAEVRRVSGVSRDCISASDIRRGAQAFGLHCRARSLELSELAALKLPVVVHLRFIHFVVLEQMSAETVRINCPAAGILDVPMQEFDDKFTGIVLSLSPGEDFQKTVAPFLREKRRWFCARWFTGYAAGVLSVEAVGSCAFVFFVDELFSNTFTAGRLGACAAGLLLSTMLSVWMRRCIAERLHLVLREHLRRQTQSVPFSFFVYRLPEVLAEVLSSTRRVADSVEGNLAPVATGLFQAGIVLGGALLTDGRTGIELVASLALWCGAVALLLRWKRPAERANGGETGQEWETAFDNLYTPEWHRLGDGPDRFRLSLAGSSASEQERRLRVEAAAWLLSVAPYALIVANALLVEQNAARLSPDALLRLLTFGAATGLLVAPLSQLRSWIGWHRRHWFAIDDVMQESADATERSAKQTRPADGMVRVEDVSFRFNPTRPPLLQEVSFALRAGEQVGLTGPSGGGKSTLTELLCGIHVPESGSVWMDGREVHRIPLEEISRCIVRVDRRPVVFEGTLRENLLLGDRSIDEADLAMAIEDACLAELVGSLPEGLETRMAFNGRNFSGGQLQRLEIARALARNPRVVVLDDAVDALDLATELKIRASLRRRGCTVLLVGHRAASLAACDRMLYFYGGRISDVPFMGSSSPTTAPAELAIFGDAGAAEARVGCEVEVEDEPLRRVWKWLWPEAKELVDARGVAGATTRFEVLSHLAARHGMMPRAVRFRNQQWWRKDVGKLVVFRRDGAPLGVQSRFGGTTLFDPRNGTTVPLTQAAAGELEAEAFAFLPLAGEIVETLGQWRGRLLAASTPDALVAAFCFACIGWLCSRLIVAGGGRTEVFVPFAAVTAAACLLYAAKGFIQRCDAALAARSNRLLHTLCVNLDPDFSRRWEPAALYRAIAGLRMQLDQLRMGLRRGLLAAAIVLFGTGAAWSAGGASAGLAVLSSACCLGGMQVLSGLIAHSNGAAHEEAGLAANRQRLTALRGIGRLRLLDASAWFVGEWFQKDDLETRLSQPGRLAASFAESVAPVLAASVLWAAGSQLDRVASLVPLVWLAGMAGMECGRQVSQAIAAPTRRQNAARLLAGPRMSGEETAREDWSLLSARDVSCSYPGQRSPILQGISLDVRAGEMTVLTGPSGGGKSTLLRILLGMQRADAGRVLVDGKDLDSIRLGEWHSGMAGVFQGEILQQTATIRSQLANGTMYPLWRVWKVLEMVEMADDVRSMPMGLQTIVEASRISNGQQQRLLMAKALLANPRLMVLDEATNAIPEAMQQRIFGRLREQKVGCLIVTHRQSVIDAADAVYLVNGPVFFTGAAAASKAGEYEATFAIEEAEIA
jgi:ABC-type bacteriocin/lantibiotic exporter with double-glycine peptidase domain